MSPRIIKPGKSTRRAVAAVELAIILPVLLLLVLAATDFGRIVHAYIVLSHGARAGAGYGATHRFTTFTRASWETQVQQAVLRELAGMPDFNSSNVQISIETTTETSDRNRVAVQVSYPFSTIVDWVGLPDNVQMTRRVEARQYR